ncbi:MAG TPA: MFS transporter [Candidatus Eisenbacteria bacterium]
MVFLWTAQFLSQFGDSIFQLAFIWMILDLTGSKSATGIAAMISYLPSLIFGVGAGLLVDRWNRRVVMIGADAARAALLALCSLLYFAGGLTAPLLTALAFGVATASVLFYPARDAMLPELVSREGLNRANSLVQLSQQGAFFAGPMAAGFLIQRFGVASSFPTGALFFLGSLGALLLLRGAGAAHRGDRKEIGLAQDFRSGLAAIASDRTLVLLLTLTALDNLFIMGPAIVGNAVLVRDTLHGNASAYAMVEATYGVAMIVGSLTVGRLGPRIGYGRLLLIGITLDGLTYIPVLFCRTLPFLIAISFVHALAIPMITIPRTTLLQEMIAPRFQGRVFALVNVVVLGTTAISSGLAGLALDHMTAPVLFGWIGCLAAATGLLGFASGRLRRL